MVCSLSPNNFTHLDYSVYKNNTNNQLGTKDKGLKNYKSKSHNSGNQVHFLALKISKKIVFVHLMYYLLAVKKKL